VQPIALSGANGNATVEVVITFDMPLLGFAAVYLPNGDQRCLGRSHGVSNAVYFNNGVATAAVDHVKVRLNWRSAHAIKPSGERFERHQITTVLATTPRAHRCPTSAHIPELV
jgi:hypothetical protein